MAEHLTFNQGARGSNPRWLTKKDPKQCFGSFLCKSIVLSTGKKHHSFRFCHLCVKLLTKSDKRFIISLQVNIGIFSEHGLRTLRGNRGTGCKSPTQKRHCKCGKGSFRRKGAATRKKSGEGESNPCGNTPQSTKSGYSVPISAFGFPKGASMQCIKMFAPRFEKNFGAFLLRKPAAQYCAIL